jgi:hypothetical protein
MADTKDLLDFLEGGIGMFFDMRLELLGVELAPMPPALFGVNAPFLAATRYR